MKPVELYSVFVVIAVGGMLSRSSAVRIVRPVLKDVKLWNNNKYLQHNIGLDSDDPHFNISINVLRQVDNVDFKTKLNLVSKLNPQYFLKGEISGSFCGILNFLNRSPLGRILINFAKQYGSVIESCPIKKGKYELAKIWYPEETFMSALPEFKFDFSYVATALDGGKRITVVKDKVKGELAAKFGELRHENIFGAIFG